MSKNVESSDVEIEKKKKKKHDQFGDDSQKLNEGWIIYVPLLYKQVYQI